MKTLPSYLGEHEKASIVQKLPSQWRDSSPIKGSNSMKEMLEAQIQNTLQLAERLNLKLNLEIEKEFNQTQGDRNKTDHDIETSTKANVKPVPINKVGEYCEGEDGNTHLPVEYANVRTMAILDSSVGVAIGTKKIWNKWGRPAL